MLRVAASTYYAAKTRPPSARAMRDAVLKVTWLAGWRANYEVYGIHKLWNRPSGRRGRGPGPGGPLVRELGIAGARRQKRVRPTKSDDQAVRHPGLVERQFTASAPNRLWVADLERHEALSNRAVMKGHRLPLVAASGQKLRAA